MLKVDSREPAIGRRGILWFANEWIDNSGNQYHILLLPRKQNAVMSLLMLCEVLS